MRVKFNKNIINKPPINARKKKSCGQMESNCFSKWQRNALTKVSSSGDPMATPSIVAN